MRLESYQVIHNDKLLHRNHSYEDLANRYGTPLYLFDEPSFIERVNRYKLNFQSEQFETQVLYASKALLTVAIAKLISQLNIGQDVVSAGEIFVGLKGGIDPDKMYFHGNNKSNEELMYALENNVKTIVIDNRLEAERLAKIANELNKCPNVLLRLNPGIEAHTHEYIKTASLDSKFGESVFDPEIFTIINRISSYSSLNFVGFHCHIGSQIFEQESFLKAASEMIEFASRVQEEMNHPITELNFGGGFGVYYTKEDRPIYMVDFLPKFVRFVETESNQFNLKLNKICIEPGRSLVNASGSTLYTVGDTKKTVGGKHYLFVDGGMSDNIRPALYQAKYEAAIVNRMVADDSTTYIVAGKACESGDKLIEKINLPTVQSGDLLLVNGTGAYNYSMASNYNRLSKPAMIHLTDFDHRLTVKRESMEDLIKSELI